MSAAARFAMRSPARLEWHPAHEELGAADPETFHLHIEFVHAHGMPKGQFTTFSACTPTESLASRTGHDGARGK
jgi:hypothetical protein